MIENRTAPALQSAELRSRYEELRQRAVHTGSALGSRRWGPVVLLRCGMAGWMSAPGEGAGDRPEPGTPAAFCPAPQRGQMVALLTELVLSTCRE